MATHPIPVGTVNLPVNIRAEERAILGRLAFAQDVSLGEFVRRCILRQVSAQDPHTAAQISEIRSKRRAARSGVLLGLFLVGLASGDLGEIRRAPRGVRVGRRRDDVEEVAA